MDREEKERETAGGRRQAAKGGIAGAKAFLSSRDENTQFIISPQGQRVQVIPSTRA